MDNAITHPSSGVNIPYATVLKALDDQGITHYPMSLTSDDEKDAIVRAVNQGIDSHLEACFVPARGDKYDSGERSIVATEDAAHWKAGDKLVLARTPECVVSRDSLPVLLRRLADLDYDEDNEASTLAGDILQGLGINDDGRYERPED